MPDTVVIVPEGGDLPLADLVMEYAVVSALKEHYESMEREVLVCDNMPESREQGPARVLDEIRERIGPEAFIGPDPPMDAEIVATADCGMAADEGFVEGMISVLDGMGDEARDTADALRSALSGWRYASGQILCEIGQPASGLNSDRKEATGGDGGERDLEADEGEEDGTDGSEDASQPYLPSVAADHSRIPSCYAHPAPAPEGDGTVF